MPLVKDVSSRSHEHNHIMGFLTIVTTSYNSYGIPTSTSFLFPSSNLWHGNSVISTLCIVSHCFFHVSRDQPSSNFMTSPGILARMLNPVIQESINSLLSNFYFRPSWSSTLRMQSHTYSPDPFQYMLASSCTSFGASSLSCFIYLRTSSAILWVSRINVNSDPVYNLTLVIGLMGNREGGVSPEAGIWYPQGWGLYMPSSVRWWVLALNRDEWATSAVSEGSEVYEKSQSSGKSMKTSLYHQSPGFSQPRC